MWLFDPAGETMDVYDHTGTRVATDRPFGNNETNDDGHWRGDFPDGVLVVLDETFLAELQANGLTTYAGQCLRHGAFELIEEGTP